MLNILNLFKRYSLKSAALDFNKSLEFLLFIRIFDQVSTTSSLILVKLLKLPKVK